MLVIQAIALFVSGWLFSLVVHCWKTQKARQSNQINLDGRYVGQPGNVEPSKNREWAMSQLFSKECTFYAPPGWIVEKNGQPVMGRVVFTEEDRLSVKRASI